MAHLMSKTLYETFKKQGFNMGKHIVVVPDKRNFNELYYGTYRKPKRDYFEEVKEEVNQILNKK